MIRRIAMTLALAAVLLAGLAPGAGAQLSENLGALSGDNAKGYLQPLPDALSATMNSAIFQSGNVPKMGVNFTVGVKLMAVQFDDADRLFTPKDPSGFSSTPPIQKVPTVIGDTSAVGQSGSGGTTLFYPGGLDISKFFLAVPQLTIGSVMGTRAVVRWISLDVGDSDFGKISFLGVGAQHSVSQYVPGLPVDLALGLFYQTFKIGSSDLVKTNSLHVDVTGSRSFGLLQPYASVGYDTFKMEANYEDKNNPGNNIHVDFDRKSNAHLTAGVLANLAFVKVHGEVNLAAVNGAAVGLSFGI